MMKRVTILFILLVALVACRGEDSAPADDGTSSQTADTVELGAGSGEAVGGTHTYVIDPAQSKASYIVQEEFFSGALEKRGIRLNQKINYT